MTKLFSPFVSVAQKLLIVLLVGGAMVANGAADVLFFRGKQSHPADETAIEEAAEFYGLDVRTVDATSRQAVDRTLRQLHRSDTLAILIAQDALPEVNQFQLQAESRRPDGTAIPILVFGISVDGDSKALQAWSGGAVRGCTQKLANYRPSALVVGRLGALTGTLAGEELPAVASPACKLDVLQNRAIESVLTARDNGKDDTPIFVREKIGKKETFFLIQMEMFDRSWIGQPDLPKAFSSMAPFVMFLSYAAGERAWHSNGHYANLTIDDAWLTKSFGHLDYAALLPEMERHNFHTTIAFIPWNFDRSEPDTVSLFRAHPERFSICIHGNNHDHREFGDYATRPLEGQIADIKQGVARMERFHELTNLPYDRLMVFPHAQAPQATFAALKTYGFLATANASNVPMGEAFPNDPTFLFRPYTESYANLLSLVRHPAGGGVSRLDIAVQSFFGGPLLFYGHENIFAKSTRGFNGVADLVNEIQPDTKWAGLAEIARHSYLARLREDKVFEVRMLSSEVDITNPTGTDAVFEVQRHEDFSPEIHSLTVDGTSVPFERSVHEVRVRISIPAHQVKRISITYQSEFQPAMEDIRKNDVHAYMLRRVSDFRDLHLSRSKWGAAISDAYYRGNWDSVEFYLEQKWLVMLGVGTLVALVLYRRRKARRKRFSRTIEGTVRGAH